MTRHTGAGEVGPVRRQLLELKNNDPKIRTPRLMILTHNWFYRRRSDAGLFVEADNAIQRAEEPHKAIGTWHAGFRFPHAGAARVPGQADLTRLRVLSDKAMAKNSCAGAMCRAPSSRGRTAVLRPAGFKH